ncbi:hypothetical protein F5X68DRAFT_264224, partial [Plectosphaerella plurivora]
WSLAQPRVRGTGSRAERGCWEALGRKPPLPAHPRPLLCTPITASCAAPVAVLHYPLRHVIRERVGPGHTR